MALFRSSLVIVAVLSASAARVQIKKTNQAGETNQAEEAANCEQKVPGSEARSCASRIGFINTCSNKKVKCKCLLHATLQGDDAACKVEGDRKFDPDAVWGKGCRCVTPKWVPTDKKLVNFNCPVESYFKTLRPELDDFAATALSWCNSKDVPADKLVPEALRGLYWMKNGNPHDIAFCTTRSEWDAETMTAKMSPWTDFVWRKRDDEEIPATPKKLSGLVYSLKFKDMSMAYANITTNVGVVNLIANLPLVEVQVTEDVAGGVIHSTKQGDIYERPTSVFGKQIAKYYAVRVVDDAGNVNAEWYKQMAENEHVVHEEDPWFGPAVTVKTSFVRYDQTCDDAKVETRK